MKQRIFAIRGNICYSVSKTEIKTVENGYLLSIDGKSGGVFETLPEEYREIPVADYSGMLVIPGMTDLHVHAPQFSFRGLGMDLELLDWLNTHTFPEESRYQDTVYANEVYTAFVDTLRKGATSRAVIFGTIHTPATTLLMEKLEAAGLVSYVGKVNMDRNSPAFLTEDTAQASLKNTEEWLEEIQDRFRNTKPILTPRFTPSCTDRLMEGLGKLREKYDLPVQSHLDENLSEVAWVKELCPWSASYGDTYARWGLLEGNPGSIMAHCIYLEDSEVELLRKHGTFIAHCPQSNINLASGIAPAGRYLDLDMPIGLGSDMAGGASSSMFRAITDAIGVSKLHWRLLNEERKWLSFAETFYMATMGGGAFFGKVGSFLPGYELDALVLPEKISAVPRKKLLEKLEQTIYLSDEEGGILHKYVQGERLF